MNTVRLLTYVGAMLLLNVSVITACYQFDELSVTVEGGDVLFSLPKHKLDKKDVRYILYGIAVDVADKSICGTDCIRWEMVRSSTQTLTLSEENFIHFPIRYGVTLPNMQSRITQNLSQGDYSVDAVIGTVNEGQVSASRHFIGKFTIR